MSSDVVNIRVISVTKGEVTIKVKVSPDMAPLVQVVAYTGLTSENIIAHKADFDTEKCFANMVSVTTLLSSMMTAGMFCIIKETGVWTCCCGGVINGVKKCPNNDFFSRCHWSFLPVKLSQERRTHCS